MTQHEQIGGRQVLKTPLGACSIPEAIFMALSTFLTLKKIKLEYLYIGVDPGDSSTLRVSTSSFEVTALTASSPE